MSDEPPNKKFRLDDEDHGESELICLEGMLPEILEAIFKFLPFYDQMRLMQVCKKFYDVLQLPVFAKKVVLALEFCVLSPLCPPYNFLINSKRRFYNLRFGDRVCIWRCQNSELWRQIGASCEHIILSSLDEYKGFDQILFEFPKLQNLSLHYQDFLIFAIPETVRNITILHEVPREISKEFAQKVNPQLDGFIVKKFYVANEGSRKYWLFDVDLPQGINLSLSVDVVPIDIVKKQVITVADIENLELWDLQSLDGFVNLQKISLEISDRGCFFVHSTQSLPNLHFVTIICPRTNPKGICNTCLMFCKESSTKIDSLKVMGEKFPRLYQLIDTLPSKPLKTLILNVRCDYNEICLNQPELEKLDFNVKSLSNYYFNCDELPHTTKLTDLSLTSYNISSQVTISNLHTLIRKCPLMEKFEFPSLSVDDILMIEEGWPNLIELKFHNNIDREMVARLQGNFKNLKVFGNPRGDMNRGDKKHRYIGELFTKIPTLRRSRIDYDTYCLIEYNLPQIILKPINYDEDSVEEEEEEEEESDLGSDADNSF